MNNCAIIYISVAICIVLYLIFTESSKDHFNRDSVYFNIPFLVTLPTRNFPIYPDIRGEPNIVYRMGPLGTILPYGYRFGPYMYDSQGNYFKYLDDTHYIA